jgi:hypothetical protein
VSNARVTLLTFLLVLAPAVGAYKGASESPEMAAFCAIVNALVALVAVGAIEAARRTERPRPPATVGAVLSRMRREDRAKSELLHDIASSSGVNSEPRDDVDPSRRSR